MPSRSAPPLPGQIVTVRMRALYEVQAARIEPIGIAYLYPQGG